MRCPRDNFGLVERSIGEFKVMECAKCRGMWMSMENFRSLVKGKAEEQTAAAPAADEGDATNNRHGAIACPEGCGGLMMQKEYKGVQVDICHTHRAFWLDGGELELLLELRGPEDGKEKLEDLGKPEKKDSVLEGVDVAGPVIEFVVDVFTGW